MWGIISKTVFATSDFFFFQRSWGTVYQCLFNSSIWHNGSLFLHVSILAFVWDHLNPVPAMCHLIAKNMSRADFVHIGSDGPELKTEGSVKQLNSRNHLLCLTHLSFIITMLNEIHWHHAVDSWVVHNKLKYSTNLCSLCFYLYQNGKKRISGFLCLL